MERRGGKVQTEKTDRDGNLELDKKTTFRKLLTLIFC